MRPKVSIIIPIYNVEAYLKACLDSVLAQSETDWECIMVDDCSTDASAEIARSYLSDPRFTLLTTPRNSGQSAARNAGMRAARGEYLAFLDSDDSLTSDSLAVLLSGQADADIIIGSERDGGPDAFIEMSGREACLQSLYQKPSGGRRVTCSPWGRLIRRSLMEGERFREGTIYEDLELITPLLLKAEKVAVTGRRVYNYNTRAGSTTNSFSLKRLDVLEVTRRLEERFAADPEIAKAARDRRLSANFNMYILLNRNGMGGRPEADGCMAQIRRLRRESLLNPRVRLKNKLGIIGSYLGRRLFTAMLSFC